METKLDKDLYRWAREQYRQWNKDELAARIRDAGSLTPEEAWRRYCDLVEFCWKICPEQSERQREQKLQALDRYYERVQRFEAWRRERGKTT